MMVYNVTRKIVKQDRKLSTQLKGGKEKKVSVGVGFRIKKPRRSYSKNQIIYWFLTS
jgi:hypothetical protein